MFLKSPEKEDFFRKSFWIRVRFLIALNAKLNTVYSFFDYWISEIERERCVPEGGEETPGCGQVHFSWLINETFLNLNLVHDVI